MTCDDYRQAIAADPSRADHEGHVSQCAACREYLAEVRALDEHIGRALAIDVPAWVMPELPAADAADVVALTPRRRAPAWFALAATIVAAAIIGVLTLGPRVDDVSLGDQVLAHLDHERASLTVTRVAVSDDTLRTVLPASVSTLDHSAGLVTYARTCDINGHPVPHLVIQGRSGPVTILLMPEEPLAEAVRLNGEHVNGVILPVGEGSVAIIGEREERLDDIQREVLNSVTWTT